MRQEIIATVREYEHKSTSYSGNPQYRVLMERLDGTEFEAITARDALAAYYVKGHKGATYVVKFHVTQKGTNVIDFLSDLEPRRYAYEAGRKVRYYDDYHTAYVCNIMDHGPRAKLFTLDTQTGKVIKDTFPRRQDGVK